MGLQKTSKDSAYYFMEPTAEEGVSKDTLRKTTKYALKK